MIQIPNTHIHVEYIVPRKRTDINISIHGSYFQK
jgi:hypothetical protein